MDLGWSRSAGDDDLWESADGVTLFLRRDLDSGELGCLVSGADRDPVIRRFDDLEARMDAYSSDELLLGIEAAVRSIAYLRWAEMLRPLVERVFDEDPDERVQRQAGRVLTAFDALAARNG